MLEIHFLTAVSNFCQVFENFETSDSHKNQRQRNGHLELFHDEQSSRESQCSKFEKP